MQLFFLLFLLFFGVKAFEEDNVVKIPLQRNFVSKDVLMERQNVRLEKLGIKKRSLPPYHQKLLESTFRNDYFTMNISLGTPAQSFQVMISSGSTRLWILDKECPSKSSSQHTYNPRNSNTSKDVSKDFSQLDGSFKSFGKYYSDYFQFGHIKTNDLIFGSVQKIENKDDDSFLFPVDGVLGFNHFIDALYKNGSELSAPIDNILKKLPLKIVNIYLNLSLSTNVTPSQNGLITFGAFDREHCNATPTITFQLGQNSNFTRYTAYIYYLFYKGSIIERTKFAYFDSGVSNLILPLGSFQQIIAYISPDYDWDHGTYVFPCNQYKNLGNIMFRLDSSSGFDFSVTPQIYLLDINLNNGNCAVGLELNDGSYQEDYVIGSLIFQQYCVTHDLTANTVHLYTRNNFKT